MRLRLPAGGAQRGRSGVGLRQQDLRGGAGDGGQDESHSLVDALASALRAHPGICVRLEGHTNSQCGLSCDGREDCANARCAALFKGKGGAVGASLARAEAVKAALVAQDGVDADRIVAIGLAGSRRLVDDTNGPGNHRNRRVEVHTLEFC